MIEVTDINADFEREPLKSPFGFKGNYVSELWQSAAYMETVSGAHAVGLGTQSPLWSDADVFAAHPESAGNSMMFLLTEFALRRAKELPFDTPLELVDGLYPEVYGYGKKITGNPDLRPTFALNALVAVDNAAWLLYAKERGAGSFDAMVPQQFRQAVSHRHDKLAGIPLVAYGVSAGEVREMLEDGFFLLKIKIGSDPDRDGDRDKMLDWDMARLSSIHAIAKGFETPHTEDGNIPYYLDANGRYDGRDRLMRFLDHADSIGALERIVLLEEPFPEELKIAVDDIPVTLAADESAHTDKDALERIDMGYRAIALKPIAKTLSMSLKIAALAYKRDTCCFCADLTVNPVLVEWNKNVAARLAPFPGLKTGLLETNGHQNYLNWERMKSYSPSHGKRWTRMAGGVFDLDEEFYSESGCIFDESVHYMELFSGGRRG